MSISTNNSKGFIKKPRLETKKPTETVKSVKCNERTDEEKATEQKETQDQLLERLAAEELLKEATKTKTRVEIGGASEWKKKPPSRINKMFLVNSVLTAEAQNKRKRKNNHNKD